MGLILGPYIPHNAQVIGRGMSVLQSTTPVLLCTKKYCSSTTLYSKVLQRTTPVLLQCYSVLQSTTPALLCTTKHYGVLLQYYSVLQSSSHDCSLAHMKSCLQCAEQQESPSNFTKYCACHAKWISWLIRLTYEESFTMRGAGKVTLQTRQVVRLPRNSEFKIWARNPLNCFRR